MNRLFLFLSLLLLNFNLNAQKIDTDSLLVETLKELNENKNIGKAKQLSELGIKTAPDYLDFYLVSGRIYWLQNDKEKARIDFKKVIDKNTNYRDAFLYLSKLEIEDKKPAAANETLDKALVFYPNDKDFELLKAVAIALENDDEKTIAYLEALSKKYPDDLNIKNQLTELKLKSTSDRIGVTYNNTTFNRESVGPWHLIGLQYIRERKKLTLIGRAYYAERHGYDSFQNSGTQFELETYFKNGKKSYSFANIAFSDQIVFPKIRFAYSYFQSFGKSWEADLGFRYTKVPNDDIYAGVLGIGKYVGPYWLNLKSYLQWDQDKIYPAFTATARYYFETKFDYATLLAGYGTSPDERVTLGQFQQRVALNSYRIGAGYYKLLWNHYCAGIQGVFNRQEYFMGEYQNEFDLFVSLQYKF